MATLPKEPIVAALSSVLLPALKPHGFAKHGKLDMVRVRGSIVQRIGASSWLKGEYFRCFYDLNALFAFKEADHGDFGGRMCDPGSHQELWPSATQQSAELSMSKLVAEITIKVLPLFDQTASAGGLLQHITALQNRSKEHSGMLSPHWEFERACCAATMGDFAAAESYILSAKAIYATSISVLAGQRIALCDALLAAIESHTAQVLLMQWTKQTAANLRVTKFIGGD